MEVGRGREEPVTRCGVPLHLCGRRGRERWLSDRRVASGEHLWASQFVAQPGLSCLREDVENSRPRPWKSCRPVPPLRSPSWLCGAGRAPDLRVRSVANPMQNLTDGVGVLEERI